MSNPYLTNLAELRQLEARLDQRLELIQKAEVNLKGLFEALRTQVSGAYPVLEELKKLIPEARERIDESRFESSLHQTADGIATAMTERLFEAIDHAKQEIDAFAGPMRQKMVDDLRGVVHAARASIESIQPQIPEPTEATDALNQMAEGFRI
jgi:predicted  nucleic acid-binding Zn-ribbon protein